MFCLFVVVLMKENQFGKNTLVEWTDKKRHLGMPISFTRYSLVSKKDSWTKLFVQSGLFSTSTEEVNLFRIFDMQVYQSLFDKMFNVGTITLYTKDESSSIIYLTNVKNPYKVRNLIAQRVEEEREKKGFRVGEFQSTY